MPTFTVNFLLLAAQYLGWPAGGTVAHAFAWAGKSSPRNAPICLLICGCCQLIRKQKILSEKCSPRASVCVLCKAPLIDSKLPGDGVEGDSAH